MKGTLLNTATVIGGSIAGMLIGSLLPDSAESLVMSALGIITVTIGMKYLLGTKNLAWLCVALVVGGLIGLCLHLHDGLVGFAEWAQNQFKGQGGFAEGFVAASVLFCVGPMTILGCIEDGVEGKSESLMIKSTMDGFAAIFLAATFGAGVLLSAAFVLVVQGLLTLFASKLAFLREDTEAMNELCSAGGGILLLIGLSLLDLKKSPTANFLPSLILAPALVRLSRRWLGGTKQSPASPSQL
ncbi:MAG TPA: DUF554 domain-containing protein [Fimbriimonas sp.]|nr:DUF554 domain-containing protein [Fimbriimonas sp.]